MTVCYQDLDECITKIQTLVSAVDLRASLNLLIDEIDFGYDYFDNDSLAEYDLNLRNLYKELIRARKISRDLFGDEVQNNV